MRNRALIIHHPFTWLVNSNIHVVVSESLVYVPIRNNFTSQEYSAYVQILSPLSLTDATHSLNY